MTWLDEAKRRAEDLFPLDPNFKQVIRHDAPRAYALLERARAILKETVKYGAGFGCSCLNCRTVSLLRDLEGGEDGQDEKG